MDGLSLSGTPWIYLSPRCQQDESSLGTHLNIFISVKMTFIFKNWVNMKAFRRSQAWVNNIKHKHVLHWCWSADLLFLNRNRTRFSIKSDRTEIIPYDYFSKRITSLSDLGIFPPGHFTVQQCCYNRFCDPSHIHRRWNQ